MEIITRSDAIKQGLKFYFTGKPCKRNHINKRYLGGHCVSCVQLSWKNRDKEAYKVKNKERNNRRRPYIKQHNKKYYLEHKEEILKVNKRYHLANLEFIRPSRNANTRKRQAIKQKAFPKWADENAIKEVYKNCPKGYHVDHIIPLQGRLISGLHVHNNLNYLLPYDNVSKGNRFIPRTQYPNGATEDFDSKFWASL